MNNPFPLFLRPSTRPLRDLTDEELVNIQNLEHLRGRTTISNGSISAKIFVVDENSAENGNINEYPLLASACESIDTELYRQLLFLVKHDTTTTPRYGLKQPEREKLEEFTERYQKIRCNGNVTNIEYERPKFAGRFYSYKGHVNILTFPNVLRNDILHHSGYVDVDLTLSGLSMMIVLSKLLALPAHTMEQIRRNENVFVQAIQDYWCEDAIITRSCAKKLIAIIVSGGTVNTWINNEDNDTRPLIQKNHDSICPMVQSLIRERRVIAETNYECNTALAEKIRIFRISKEKPVEPYHMINATLSSVNCHLEHAIVYSHLKNLTDQDAILRINGKYCFSWGFDGFCFKPADPDYSIEEVIASASEMFHHQCEGWGDLCEMRLKKFSLNYPLDIFQPTNEIWADDLFKDFMTTNQINIQADFHKSYDWDYTALKRYIEDTLGICKIYDSADYLQVFRHPDGRLKCTRRLSSSEVKEMHRNLSFDATEEGKKKKRKLFVESWMNDNNIRVWNSVGQYPPPLVCPVNVFNTWTESPWHNKSFPIGTGPVADAVPRFYHLMNVICGHDPISINFMEHFICILFQKPGYKHGVMPLICGSEGTGKNTFISWIRLLTGMERTVSSIFDHIFGNFNGIIHNKFLVIVEEFPRVVPKHLISQFKQTLTESRIQNHQKFREAEETESFHHFIGSSNDPVVTPSFRRCVTIKSANDLIRDAEYFQSIYAFMKRDEVNQTIYNHFMSIDMESKFGSTLVAPKTQLSISFRELHHKLFKFIKYLNSQVFPDGMEVTLDRKHLYQNIFKSWVAEYGYENNDFVLTMNDHDDLHAAFIQYSWSVGCMSKDFIPAGTQFEANVFNFKKMVEDIENLRV